MTFESELAKLTLERSRSVNQIAKLWGDKALILSPETPKAEPDRPGLTGSQLITRLQANAKVIFQVAIVCRLLSVYQTRLYTAPILRLHSRLY